MYFYGIRTKTSLYCGAFYTRLYRTNDTDGSTLLETKYFIGGNYEIETEPNGSERKLHYHSATTGIFAIFVQENENENMYYIHKDYLGSFQSITNEDGELVEKLSFDPCSVTPGFGELANPNPLVELIPAEERSREGRRRRNPDDWSFNKVPVDFLFDRGYTGHQHLVAFGLINMNGRVYDPYVARFLSPDPFVQNPNGRQGLNRYSYVENNPLKFTDPSGYTNHPMSAAANNYICYEAWGILSEAYSGPLTSGSGNHWSDEYSQGVQADFNRMSRKGFDKLHGDGSYNKIIDDNPSNEDWGTNGYWVTVENSNLIGEEAAFLISENIHLVNALSFIIGPHIINKFISIGGSAGGGVSGDNIFAKTYLHFQIGGGDPLTIDASTLNFGNISKSDLKNLGNGRYGLNLYDKNPTSQAAIALGKITLTDQGNNQYSISPDYYDFNIEWQNGFSKRNIATFGAGILHYGVNPVMPSYPLVPLIFGGPYWIHFQGNVQIKP